MAPIRNTRADKNKAIFVASSSEENPIERTANEPRSQQVVAHDSTYSDLMEQFQFPVMDKWRKKVDAEVQKREGLEARLKILQGMCMSLAERGLKLENALKESEELEELCAPVVAAGRVEEEVESKFNLDRDALCKVCKSKKAIIVLVPCRHLSVCASCDSRVSRCPVCNVIRRDSFRASLDGTPKKGYQGICL